LKPTTEKKHSTATGIVLMSISMLTIPMVDAIAKYLSSTHSPLYISWARYVVACGVVLPVAIARYRSEFLPREQIGAHFLRTVFLMAAMTSYFLAIARIPLATAISAYFVAPIIAMVLAVLFLGETLTRRKIFSLVLGFAGALVILRPSASMDAGLWLAIGAGGFFAFYMIATRQASLESDPIKTLAFQCLVGVVLLTPQALWTWSIPAAGELWLFALMGVMSAGCHFLSIVAFRYAQASILAPLVYLELLGGAVIGFFMFGDVPDVYIWIGAVTIMVAGSMTLERSR
jgi:drug/metabolite transporter (DMT)-like permease